MKRSVLVLALLLLMASAAFGQLAYTTVADVLHNPVPSGLCAGSISISNSGFYYGGVLVAAAAVSSPIRNGVLNVRLVPGNYTVLYLTSPGCAPPKEYWIVPLSGSPVSLSTVRTLPPLPTLPAMVPLSWLTQSGATTGQVPQWNGSVWTPATVGGVTSIAFNCGIVSTQTPITTSATIGVYGLCASIANAGTTGTTLNKLAKLTGAPSTAVITATTDTGGAVGAVISGDGTTGSAIIQMSGLIPCTFDNSTTAGHYVQLSPTVAGDCHDAGATFPTSGQVIGQVMTSSAAGVRYVDTALGQASASSGGGSPAGSNGDVQMNTSGSFAAAHINDTGSVVNITEPACIGTGGCADTSGLGGTASILGFKSGTSTGTMSADAALRDISNVPTWIDSGGANAMLLNGGALGTPASGNASNLTNFPASLVQAPCTTTITTGASATLSTCFTVNQHATAATAITYTLPTASSGAQFCADNGYNGSAADTGTVEFLTSAAGQYLVWTDGTLSASGGYGISAGAARDGACVYGVDSTHWMFLPHSGTWTKH